MFSFSATTFLANINMSTNVNTNSSFSISPDNTVPATRLLYIERSCNMRETRLCLAYLSAKELSPAEERILVQDGYAGTIYKSLVPYLNVHEAKTRLATRAP